MGRIPLGGGLLVLAAVALLSGCRGATSAPPAALPALDRSPLGTVDRQDGHPLDKIQHIVIVVQENRSLNNLFYGFPGAKTVTYGLDSHNGKIALKPVGLSTSWDLEHNAAGFEAACNGTGKVPGTDCKMNGFNNETWTCGGANPPCPIKYPPYSYVPHDESAPYFDLGKQYVLADQMYASNFDTSSFVSHQYIIGAQANSTINYPLTNWGCPGGKPDTIWTTNSQRGFVKEIPVCFDNTTLADELDAKQVSWAFYASPVQGGTGKSCGDGAGPDTYKESNGIWSAYQAIKHICYGPDWDSDVISPSTKFLTDVGNGTMRSVTWIVPTCVNSDHPGCNSDTGPSWVASVVNAVGESKFWDSTAIFVFWDDYGGFYDPEPPKYVDYDGLGGRIPMLIISPYAKKGYVSHVHYEHGSILRFVEDRYGLARLSASDKRAVSPEADSFDFSQKPRKFVPIKSKYDLQFFLHQAPDLRPPDTD
jgi:phospholipase C